MWKQPCCLCNCLVLFAGSSEKEDTSAASTGTKRKAVDQGLKCNPFCNQFVRHMDPLLFVIQSHDRSSA